MNRADKRRRRRKLVLNKLGLSLCAFAALVVLAVLGILLIRSTLLRNALPQLCRRGEQQPGHV